MINVVKIGGNVIDNPEALEKFLREFASLEGDKILVHGGGKEATRMSESMGVPTTMSRHRPCHTQHSDYGLCRIDQQAYRRALAEIRV